MSPALFPLTAGQMNKMFALTALAALTLLNSATAFADSNARQYLIPAQSLNNALMQFAADANVKLLFPADKVRGLSANKLEGKMTTTQALAKLLQGSGMTYRFVDANTVTIEPPASNLIKTANEADNPSAQTGGETLPKVTVEADAGNPYTDPAWATDPHNPDYKRPNALTATKTDTPVMETPFSVQVVPKQVFDDQQVVRVDKALQNVSGVTQSTANGGGIDSFVIRGFFTQSIYRDGVLIPDLLAGPTTKRETANLERIEVLKGPGSLLYGRNEPGGIINLVTKQPLAVPFYSLQQQFGSFDFYRTTLDATGPVTKDDSLLYRFNLAYENTDSFRDFHNNNDRVFFSPVLTWNISPSTKATLEYEFQHVDERLDNGVPPFGNRPAPVPRERSIQDPALNRNVVDRNYLGFHWTHAFNDQWTLSQRFSMELIDLPISQGSYVGSDVSDNGSFIRPLWSYPAKSDRYFTNLNLTGKFSTWDLRHTLLLGGDYYRLDDRYLGSNIYPGPDFNVFKPVYLTQAPQFGPADDVLNLSTSWHGLYFQDQIELPFNVFVLGGFRYDSAQIKNNLSLKELGDDNRVSPRGGLLWRPIPELSLYGSYSENFGASNTLDEDNKALPPQTAQQWETGIKTELLNGRLTGTLAYYQLTKQNLKVIDPLTDPQRSRAIGEAESHGLEFDLAGEILPGWRLIGAYTYMPFAEITNDGAGENVGKRLLLAPKHSGSFWTTYEFEQGDLRGLKLGAGMRAAGQRQGNPQNSYQLPGFAIMSLMASYGFKVNKANLTFQLNVDNLLDKTYFLGTNTSGHIQFGAPRTFLGSVKIDF